MLLLDVAAGAAGAFLILWSQRDLFQSVIVPRSVGGRFRPSVLISRNLWKAWRAFALRIDDTEKREDTLAVFAPTFLMTLLAYWVASQVVGLGLLFWALRGGIHPVPTLGASIYFAGTSLLTIGYGDYAPVNGITRFLALFAAASGLGTFAIVTTFLFQTFGAFQRREAFVVTIAERTGSPPSGLEFLKRHIKLGIVDDIGAILRESQRWISEVMETHLAYPVLTYFRSSHDDELRFGRGRLFGHGHLPERCIVYRVSSSGRGQITLGLPAENPARAQIPVYTTSRDTIDPQYKHAPPLNPNTEKTMSAIIITYKLKDGVTPADFEAWVKNTDHPTMRGLARVQRFETYRVTGLLIGEGAPSCSYVEIFDVPDLAGFTGTDMGGEAVQSVLGQFMGFVSAPEFLVAEVTDPT